MLKRILLNISLLVSLSAMAQSGTDSIQFKNVLGLDITGLLNQFFNANSGGGFYNYSPYLISYRRIFGESALRSGLGGYVSNSDGVTNDTTRTRQKHMDLSIHLGYEKTIFRYRRWGFYAGCDAYYNYSYDLYRDKRGDYYHRVQQTLRNEFGVAPVCGLTYQINQRLALATEAGYQVGWFMSKRDEIYSSLGFGSQNMITESSGVLTQFYAPYLLSVRIGF